MYKIEIQEDNGVWRDVRDADGKILTFENDGDARAKLKELYPVLVEMEKYAAPKRTRVIAIWNDDDDEDDIDGESS